MAQPPTPPRDGLLEVGRVVRSHGLRGEVVVDFTSDRPERTSAGAVLVSTGGDLVVAEARPHQSRWLVRFDGRGTREDADAMRDTVLWAEPLDDDDTIWVHDLVGCTVVDASGVDRGVVASVDANPAHDMLVLTDGTLVPVTFVVGTPSDGVVSVDTPEGLFDL